MSLLQQLQIGKNNDLNGIDKLLQITILRSVMIVEYIIAHLNHVTALQVL